MRLPGKSERGEGVGNVRVGVILKQVTARPTVCFSVMSKQKKQFSFHFVRGMMKIPSKACTLRTNWIIKIYFHWIFGQFSLSKPSHVEILSKKHSSVLHFYGIL